MHGTSLARHVPRSTVATSALLIPTLGAFIPRLRLTPRGVLTHMLVVLPVTVAWLLSRHLGGSEDYLWGVEPIFPGLGVGLLAWVADRRGGRAVPLTRQDRIGDRDGPGEGGAAKRRTVGGEKTATPTRMP